MAESTTRDWDAATYQRVAVAHEDWARVVLDRLGLEGGETVLDAGCGSGRTTGILIERISDGRRGGRDARALRRASGRHRGPPPESAAFARTVCLGAHVERLPEELRDQFVDDVLATQPDPLRLDYVRLNIAARAAA
jgi:ubiquinone/menaquinone biosynthesis C-methylase UbiE